MITVAALYIDPRGPYPAMSGVDCWDEARDARLYDGPHPIVAHPPCGPWGRLRHMCRQQVADCGPRAVEQVRQWGGVLEHPAGSLLWGHCGLPGPGWAEGDDWGGRCIEVHQVEWGHVARKRTWLYLVGVPSVALEHPCFVGREPTHHVSRDAARARRNGYTLKRTSGQQNRRTPPLFAEYLVRLARAAGEARRAE